MLRTFSPLNHLIKTIFLNAREEKVQSCVFSTVNNFVREQSHGGANTILRVI